MPPLTFTLHKKKKFPCKIFFSKCDQISFLQMWSHLLKKSLMKNLYFCVLSDIMKTKLCVSDKSFNRNNEVYLLRVLFRSLLQNSNLLLDFNCKGEPTEIWVLWVPTQCFNKLCGQDFFFFFFSSVFLNFPISEKYCKLNSQYLRRGKITIKLH